MEEGKVPENHLTSAVAFVEGGIQDSCDDACSICLEAFCDSDPSTLTTCKHEFHLQCILEWCQRSSQCPMCWQSISFKDPNSQELLDAVEHERNIRMNPPRNTTIFHHPTLGNFELQHLPVSATESELEEQIIQHLAAAAAMGRARQLARREGQRSRASTQGRPQFLVFSTNPNGPSTGSVSQGDGNSPTPSVMISNPNSQFITIGQDSAQLVAHPPSPQDEQFMALATGSSGGVNNHGSPSINRRSPAPISPNSQDRAGSSDFQAFSESVKSRLGAFSMRCKESITKSTRGWKERLLARNSSTSPEPRAEVPREVKEHGMTNVSQMMDHLEISEDGRRNNITTDASNNNDIEYPAEQIVETVSVPSLHDPRASSSASN